MGKKVYNFSKLFFLLLFKYSCLHFPLTTTPSPAIPTSHPQSYPTLALSMVLYTCSLTTLPPPPPLSLPNSPLVTVNLFLISMSLVIFCLLCFVDCIPLIGEITWYLSFTTWLFHLAWCSPDPSKLSQRVRAPSFILLNSIPLHKCTVVFWSTHLLMGTKVASSTQLL